MYASTSAFQERLEALAVDDGRARLIIFALGDPHLLEGAQRRQDRTTNPHTVLTLRWSNHLDLHSGRCQCCEFLGHTLTNALEHGGATGQHDVGIEILSDINIALHDGLEGGVMNAAGLLAHKAGLEQDFWAAETLRSHCDDVAIRQFVGLLLVTALRCCLHLAVKVQSDVAKLLLATRMRS